MRAMPRGAAGGVCGGAGCRLNIASRAKPVVPLLEWQRQYVEDGSRFKLVVASAQSGKSFVTSLEFALRAMRQRKSLGIMLSASERQSVELMEKIKMHTAGWGVAIDSGFYEQTSIVQHTARFPNSNRIIALPANPDTARGYSGDVFLDEFALHRDSKAIWAAMMTRATRGYDVRVASTIKGTENKFYELVKLLGLHEGTRPGAQPVTRNGWSGHWVDIRMCREQGLDVDIEGLRAAIDDDEIFLQDYCNVPISGAECFIPPELVLACESSAASLEWDGAICDGMVAGWDVARKRDGSVVTIGQRVGDVVVVRGMIWMDRQPFEWQKTQCRAVAEAVQAAQGQFWMDATGIGAQMGEELAREFPCVMPAEFTVALKQDLAVRTKRALENHALLLPESNRVRRAFQAIKRQPGAGGQFLFDAARTSQGHADEFWSAALMLKAASGAAGYVPASDGGPVGNPVTTGLMEMTF